MTKNIFIFSCTVKMKFVVTRKESFVKSLSRIWIFKRRLDFCLLFVSGWSVCTLFVLQWVSWWTPSSGTTSDWPEQKESDRKLPVQVEGEILNRTEATHLFGICNKFHSLLVSRTSIVLKGYGHCFCCMFLVEGTKRTYKQNVILFQGCSLVPVWYFN